MKRNAIAVVWLLIALIMLSFPVFALDLAGSEQKNTYKNGPSPMDAEPKTVSFTKGEIAQADTNYKLSLDGKWSLSDKKDDWSGAVEATVPGSVHTALFEAGVIKDPYLGTNMKNANKYGEKNWYYKKTFNYGGTGKNVYLNFKGVCNVADFYLNGKKIASHEGMFGGPYIDVTDHIKKGENTLVVHLYPAKDYTRTVVFNCSYGWHYAKLYPLGVWQSVEIEDRAGVLPTDPFVSTYDYKNGTLDFAIRLDSKTKNINGELTVSVVPKNFEGKAAYFTDRVSYGGGSVTLRYRADLPDARLWWPNGYGEQNLYTLKVSFASDNAVSTAESQFGIRQLDLAAFPSGEKSNAYNRQFVVNGKNVYMKGAGWCTIDAMMRFSREDYDRILSRAHDAGINFLRAWGGGLVETDEFYDLCDEYGIAVYQEWPCCWDSSKTQPADVLYETVELNTKRLRNRPSLFVYGGGNEGEAPYSDKVLNNMGRLTYENDGTRDFWRQDGGIAAFNIRHDHIWWSGHTPEYYIKTYTAVKELNMHEYGLGSMMNRSSIEKFAARSDTDQWPIKKNGTLAYHTATFNGFYGWNPTPHGYDIDTHVYYASTFTDVNGLYDLIKGSQLAQAQADYPLAINSRIKAPYNSANVIYKLNDNYPGASWSIVDWYGAPKLSYYLMQDAYRPLMAAALADRYNTYNGSKEPEELKLPVYVLDDVQELSDKKAEVTVTAYDGYLDVIKTETFECKTGKTVNYAGEFTLSAEQTASAPMILTYDLLINDEFFNRTYMYYNYEYEPGCLFYLPRTTLEYTVSGNEVTVTNTGKKLAVCVELKSGEEDTFVCSDNMFTLTPGQSQTVVVNDASKIDGVTCFNLKYENDKTAPEAPSGVTVSDITHKSAKVSWNKVEDDTGIYAYTVKIKSGEAERTIDVYGSRTQTEIAPLAESLDFTVTVTAVDNGSNYSKPSAPVSFTTPEDREAPAVLNHWADDGRITIVFSTEMDGVNASDPARYLLNNGAEVTEARVSEDGRTVTLSTEGLEADKAYTLGVINLTDTKRAANGTGYIELNVEQGLYASVDFEADENGLSRSGGRLTAPLEALNGEPEYTDDGRSGRALSPRNGRGAKIKNVPYTFGEGKSITMWINGKASAGFNVLIAKGPKESGHFEFYTRSGKLFMYAPDCGDFDLGYDINEKDGWRQLAFVFSGGKLTVYEDGRAVSTKSVNVNVSETVNDLSFGLLNDATLPFAGYIDTVRLYDRALSEDDIKEKIKSESKTTDTAELDFENHVIELTAEDKTANLGLISSDAPYSLTLSGDSVTVKDGIIYVEKEGTTVISAVSEDKTKISGAVVTVKPVYTETETKTEAVSDELTETESAAQTEDETEKKEEKKSFKGIIIVAAVAVFAVAAVVVADLIVKKKKK